MRTMILLMALLGTSFANNVEVDTFELRKVNSSEELEKIKTGTWNQLKPIQGNRMQPILLSAWIMNSPKFYLQVPTQKNCVVRENGIEKWSCDIDLEFFEMPQATVSNDTHVFMQTVFINGRVAGMMNMNRVGYAYLGQVTHIYPSGQNRFSFYWRESPKRVENFKAFHRSELDLKSAQSLINKGLPQEDLIFAEVQSFEILEVSENKTELKLDIYWRDRMHFEVFNTLETGLVMEIDLENQSWKITQTGELDSSFENSSWEVPTPPRRNGERWNIRPKTEKAPSEKIQNENSPEILDARSELKAEQDAIEMGIPSILIGNFYL